MDFQCIIDSGGTDDATLCITTEDFVRELSPRDFADGVYFVRQSAVADLSGVANAGGYTYPWLDLLCRDAIGKRWTGRRPAAVICDHTLWNVAAWNTTDYWRPGRAGVSFRDSVVAVALHEAAHMLSRPKLVADLPDDDPARVAEFREMMCKALNRTDEEIKALGYAEMALPWANHDQRFARAAAHLAYRAKQQLPRLAYVHLFDGEAYGLSPSWKYWNALGNEMIRFAERRVSIRLLVTMPAPDEFDALFAADVAAYHKSQSAA